MRKKIIVSIVVFLVLILAGVAIWGFSSGKFAGWADTGPAEIDIFTHDSNNNTVGFVDILVSSDNQNYSSVGQTQSNGHLIYQDLAFQNHTLYLKASKPYHSVSPEYRQLSVSSGNKYNTDFTVTPIAQDLTKGKLKGRVTESGTTNPINGAFIYVSNDKTGFSNAQGDYGIADINPGTYDVKVRRNDYQDAHSTAIISAGQETTLNFTLTKKSSPTPTPSNSSSPSPSTQPDSTKFTFIAEIVDAANTNSLVGGAKVEISPNPIINNVYGWEETSTDQPADETKYDKVNLKRANLVAEDLLQPTPDCNSKNTTYTVTYTHPDYQTYTPQTFNCGEIKFDQKLQTYLYNAGRVELKKIPLLSIKGTVSSYSDEKLQGAIVSLKKETNNTRIAETNTGEEGRYNFDNINIEKTASYLIKAEYPGYAPQEFKMSGQLIIDDAMYHRNINFVLLKEDRGGIRGYVIKGGDSGIKYATISVLSGDKLVVTASSDGQGNYIIPDIEPGDYTVSVYAQDYFNVEDLSGLVKKATVKEKKFTEVNFELTYKRYDATTVYLELLDHTGSPIDYENLKEPSGAEFHEVYRIYENDKGLHEKDGKQYLRFSDIPCGKDLELEVFFDYKYSAQILRYYKKTKMNFNCSGSDSDNEEYISLKMEIDPRMPQDENKGYLGGEFVLEKCDYNHFYTKWAKIILKDSQNRNYKEAIIEDERYFSIQNIDPGRYTVYLEGNNIVSDPRTINIKKGENYLTLSVRPKDSATFIKSISKNGFEIYFVGPISQDYIDSINWDDYTRALDNLKNNRVKPGLVKDFPTKIVVTDTDSQARWLGTGTCALGINGSYIQISYDELPDLVRSKDLLVMKMANYVWFNLPAATTPNENPEQEWNNFVKELNSMGNVEDCVLSALNPNSICGRYRVSAGGNLFQNVFLDYFVYHTQFDALNRNMKVSGNEQCFHLLSFFWEFFAKYVQKSASETVASTNPGSSSLFVYSNAADFYKPVGGKLGIYSKDQLLGGFWKQSVYDKLNPVQKAGVQATIVYSRVINFLKINPGKYSNQIAVNVVKFNQWIDKVLGTKGDRGTIEGMVREQSGGPKTPKENVIVIIGQKMAVTDKDGKFKIENIKIGEQKVRVIDGKTSRNLNVDLETVNIQKDKTIKRYFIVN